MARPLKVLIVEDNPADAHLIRLALQPDDQFSFRVEMADGLEPAKALCASFQPDVVLLDLHLPESSGRDTFSEFREVAQKIPVIVLSGHSDEREALQMVKEGAEDYLFKDAVANGYLVRRAVRHAVARHEMKRELVKAREEAFRASKAKSDFLSRMSHEIRTPLNAILGMAEVLMETRLDDEQWRMVKVFERAGATLNGLINELLDLSKIESGKMEIDRRPFQLKEVIDDCCQIMGDKASGKGLSLVARSSPSIPANLVGDPLRLRQILLNLIGNAIKFTERGEVRVEVRPLSSSRSETLLRFEVSDTGVGIPQDHWERIFGEFEQVSSSTYPGGTGLGLAISRKLVGLMGGRMWVESAPGSGSTFFFEIPFPASANEVLVTSTQEPEVRSFAQRALPDVSLLIAEDSEDNREVLQAFLAKQPISITMVSDGAAALEAFTGGKFSLVLMDMQMPLMDGVTATRKIREWEAGRQRKRTPIVALTAFAMEGEKQQFYDAGCDSHLSKPISKSRLLETIFLYTGATVPGAPHETAAPESRFR